MTRRPHPPAPPSPPLQDEHALRHAQGRQRPYHPPTLSDTVSEAVSGLTDGLSALVRAHLQLARVEMAADVRAVVRDLVIGLGGTPLVMVGYLLLWVALGFLLALVVPAWAAFGLCAVFNIGAGLGLMALGRARTRGKRLSLPASTEELKRNREWLGVLREPPELLRDHVEPAPRPTGATGP